MKIWTAIVAIVAALFSLPASAQTPTQDCALYESIGAGPDLVLTPGLGSAPEVWDGVSEQLAQSYTVHLVHVAGFAGRPAEGDPSTILEDTAREILSYLDCKGIERARFAGHSMGGFLSLKIASEQPERVERLVIVDSLPFFPLIFSPAATPEAVKPQADAMQAQLLSQSDEQFAQSQQQGVRSLVQNADYHSLIADWSLASDRASFASAMHALMTTDLRPELGKVTAPTTVIAAANAFAPRPRIEALYSAAYADLKGVQLQVIEDSFHFIMFDQPNAFSAALMEALE